MTKQQYVHRQGWQAIWPLIPIAVIVFSFHVYAKIHDIGSQRFWIIFDIAISCLYMQPWCHVEGRQNPLPVAPLYLNVEC